MGLEGERELQEGADICILMADSRCCIEKPTQHCKAIICQCRWRQDSGDKNK